MADNPANLFDQRSEPLIDTVKRALSALHERSEVASAAIALLQAGQVQAVDSLVGQITSNFSALFTAASVVVSALQEGRYTSAPIAGPLLFTPTPSIDLHLDVAGPIGFSPAPVIMIGRAGSRADLAIARTVAWNAATSVLTVEILNGSGAVGPHSDCYVEVGLLSALYGDDLLEEIAARQPIILDALDTVLEKAGLVETARSEVAGHRATVTQDKNAVSADRQVVAQDRAAVSTALALVAGGPVVSINGKTGIVFTDPVAAAGIQPTLDWDMTDINGAPFKGGLTRATNGGHRRNTKGVLVPTTINEPVIDFGSDGKALGTGFYGAYSNLLTYSEQFDHAVWRTGNATVTANSVLAPDGTMTADKLVSSVNGGANTCFKDYLATVAAATNYTFSVYLKQGTAPKSAVNFFRADPYASTYGEITWGATPTLAITDLGGICLSSKIELLLDGWVRVSITVNSAAATQMVCRVYVRGVGTDNVLGEYTYAWGAQLTSTAYPVPYIPTTTAAVTRAGDHMIVSGPDFTEFYNQREGTFFGEFTLSSGSVPKAVFGLSSGTFVNSLYLSVTAGLVQLHCVNGAVELDGPTVSVGSKVRAAFSYSSTGAKLSVSGSVAATDNTITLLTHDRLSIGSVPWSLGNGSLWGPMSRLIYWPKALDATTLQRMTA